MGLVRCRLRDDRRHLRPARRRHRPRLRPRRRRPDRLSDPLSRPGHRTEPHAPPHPARLGPRPPRLRRNPRPHRRRPHPRLRRNPRPSRRAGLDRRPHPRRRSGLPHVRPPTGSAAQRETQVAWFGDAIFSSDAWFDEAVFSRTAGYEGAEFADRASFRSARFAGDAWFEGRRHGTRSWPRPSRVFVVSRGSGCDPLLCARSACGNTRADPDSSARPGDDSRAFGVRPAQHRNLMPECEYLRNLGQVRARVTRASYENTCTTSRYTRLTAMPGDHRIS